MLTQNSYLAFDTFSPYTKPIKGNLKKLYSLGVRSLLVEGGDKLTKNMLRSRLINQFYLFKSSKILPMNKKHINFTSDNILKYMYKIRSKISSKLAKDTITIYK